MMGEDCYSWCGVLGRLCGGARDTMICYLCMDEVHVEVWQSGDHRSQCARRNTAQLSSLPVHPTLPCPLCKGKLRLWPAQGPGFQCDGEVAPCPGKGKEMASLGDNRFNCFLCDFDLCKDCAKVMETDLEKDKEKVIITDVIVTNDVKGEAKEIKEVKEVKEVNEAKEDFNQNKTMGNGIQDDNIPLIDIQSSYEDIPSTETSTRRPTISSVVVPRTTKGDGRQRSVASLSTGPSDLPLSNGLMAKTNVLIDSPDIFNLRAPLVSCENLTPETSHETLRGEATSQ